MGVKAPSHPFLTFFNEELPFKGATHTRPLQFTVNCMGAKVPMVLIDNGFALNVCPFRISLKVVLELERIIPSPLTVRAYDNTSRKFMETFKSPCKIGPLETIVEFHMMDISPNYNPLFGRAWLHPIGAIPSTLHQKMKIPRKGGIVVVLGDGEILAPICGLEVEENELQMSGFEFVNMLDYGLKDKRYTTDLLSYYSHKVIAMMKKMGYMLGMGLGKEGRGAAKFPNFKTQLTKMGLGFFEGRNGIKKNLGTLHGNFVKEGEDFPFCGFPKLWVDKDGKVYLGWEIFFEEKLTFQEKPTMVIKEV